MFSSYELLNTCSVFIIYLKHFQRVNHNTSMNTACRCYLLPITRLGEITEHRQNQEWLSRFRATYMY